MFHLIRRFFGHLTAKPLNEAEFQAVAGALPDGLLQLFDTMSVADKRHSLDVWDRTGRDPALAEAALLHDVGKTGGIKGAVPRSVATVLGAMRVPMHGRWAIYRDHGPIGADLLTVHGATELAIGFARHHPDHPPAGYDAAAWNRLLAADDI